MQFLNEKVKKFVEDNVDHFAYLKARWQDEREYEDFSDYEKNVRKLADAAGLKLVKMAKSFKMVIADGVDQFQFEFVGSAKFLVTEMKEKLAPVRS